MSAKITPKQGTVLIKIESSIEEGGQRDDEEGKIKNYDTLYQGSVILI